jgi:hypothetical protein
MTHAKTDEGSRRVKEVDERSHTRGGGQLHGGGGGHGVDGVGCDVGRRRSGGAVRPMVVRMRIWVRRAAGDEIFCTANLGGSHIPFSVK